MLNPHHKPKYTCKYTCTYTKEHYFKSKLGSNNGIPMENSKIKEQQMEKYMVNAGGGLYSCIADMVNFAIHIPKILTPEQIKKCYGFYPETNVITHGGFIYGGKANFKVEYTGKWKVKNISIELETWTNYDY